MKQQDFEAETKVRTKKSNNLLSQSGLCGLVAMLSMTVGGCSNNEVQITGKVKRIESKFVSTKVHKDEKTGKLTSGSYSSCNILIKSMGVLYDLNIYDSDDTELCDKVLEESAGVPCCRVLEIDYDQLKNGYYNSKLNEKVFEQCKGINCRFTTDHF